MKTAIKFTSVSLIVATLLTASTAIAQRGMVGGRIYDPSTVQAMEGKVLSMEIVTPPGGGRGMGIHLSLQTGKETIPVHLGPRWFMKNQTPQIATGDTITVTGSRVTFDGKPAIIAREIQKDGKTIKLRDDNGVPLWAGRGPKGG